MPLGANQIAATTACYHSPPGRVMPSTSFHAASPPPIPANRQNPTRLPPRACTSDEKFPRTSIAPARPAAFAIHLDCGPWQSVFRLNPRFENSCADDPAASSDQTHLEEQ